MVKLRFSNANTSNQPSSKGASSRRSSSKKDRRSDYYTVERIVEMEGTGPNAKFLVKWQGYPDSQNTWEPFENLKSCPSVIEEFFGTQTTATKRSISSQKETNKKSNSKARASNKSVTGPKVIDMLTRKERRILASSKNLIEMIDQIEIGPTSETISLAGEEDKINRNKSHSRARRPSTEPNSASKTSQPNKLNLARTKKAKNAIQALAQDNPKRVKSSKQSSPTIVDIIDCAPRQNAKKPFAKNLRKLNGLRDSTKLNANASGQTDQRASLNSANYSSIKFSHLEMIEKADSIAQHIASQGDICFKLSWPKAISTNELSNKVFTYDEVDRYNPRLLTGYLKQFIRLTSQ
jgi:hypothetical protein